MQITAKDIDAILPQTQCGLCGFKGCMPYANALAEGSAEINLCPPGGVAGLHAIAQLLAKDSTPFITDMEQKAKPSMVAVIREAECIGCTKCIQACPVDAILGSGKLMHTIITDECTGCELCIAPCPVDCIDMIATPPHTHKKVQFRNRYLTREQRLAKTNKDTVSMHDDKKEYIQNALLRVKLKKQTS